jgi:hypothetical protein
MNRFTFADPALSRYVATLPSSAPSRSSSRLMPLRSVAVVQANRWMPLRWADCHSQHLFGLLVHLQCPRRAWHWESPPERMSAS